MPKTNQSNNGIGMNSSNNDKPAFLQNNVLSNQNSSNANEKPAFLSNNSGLGMNRNQGVATNSVTSGSKPMTGQKSALVPDLDDLEEMDDAGTNNEAPAKGLGDIFGSGGVPSLDVGSSRKRYASRPSNGSMGGYKPGGF